MSAAERFANACKPNGTRRNTKHHAYIRLYTTARSVMCKRNCSDMVKQNHLIASYPVRARYIRPPPLVNIHTDRPYEINPDRITIFSITQR